MYLLCFEDIQASHSGAMSAPKSTKKQLWNPCCHWVVQMTKKSPTWIQSWSQGGSKIHQKSTKIQVWPQGVLVGVLGGLRINKMVPRDTKITPRDVKMHLPGVRKAIPGSQNGATSLSDSQPTVGTVAGCKQLDIYITKNEDIRYNHIMLDKTNG